VIYYASKNNKAHRFLSQDEFLHAIFQIAKLRDGESDSVTSLNGLMQGYFKEEMMKGK